MLQRDHGGTDKREQGFGSKPTTAHSYTEGQGIWDGATLNKSEFEIYLPKKIPISTKPWPDNFKVFYLKESKHFKEMTSYLLFYSIRF